MPQHEPIEQSAPGGEETVVVDFCKLNTNQKRKCSYCPEQRTSWTKLASPIFIRPWTWPQDTINYEQTLQIWRKRLSIQHTTPQSLTCFYLGCATHPPLIQRFMAHNLRGLQGLKCFVYLDDIVVMEGLWRIITANLWKYSKDSEITT